MYLFSKEIVDVELKEQDKWKKVSMHNKLEGEMYTDIETKNIKHRRQEKKRRQ